MKTPDIKYSLNDYVLLKNGKVERIMSIHIEPRFTKEKEWDVKYHFWRMWARFQWQDEIVSRYIPENHER
jgi:hypothetical protein